jgi:diguanylate cyclase (GGDEF)-like protein/PAS domain S-box-containing protein
MSQALTANRRSIALAGRACLLALATAAACWWAIRYTHGPANLSTVWPAGGIVCGLLLSVPRAQWPFYLAAAFAAFGGVNLAHHGVLAQALWLGLINTFEPLVVAAIVAYGVHDATDPACIKRSTLFGGVGVMLACAISASLAAWILQPASAASFGMLFATWFASHALGIIIFAAFVLVAWREGWRVLGARGQRVGLQLALVLLALMCWLVFRSVSFPWPFLILPPLLLVAFRYRFSGFALGTTLLVVIAATQHSLGYGPFMHMPDYGDLPRALALQVFIASACLLTLPVAVVLTGRDLLARRLAVSERDFRMLTEHSHDLIVRFDALGMRRYVSPSVTEMLGWSREDFAHMRWDLLHPDDVASVRRSLAELRAKGGNATVLFRARHQDGRYVWIEGNVSLLPATAAGLEAEIIFSGRDVTQRVVVEKALRNNERRLQAITANLPALVLHLDKEERYTFVNSSSARTFGSDGIAIVGRHAKEVLSAESYREIEPYMRAALRGENVTFEIERYFHGQLCHYQSNYVPDFGEDGSINGFYAVSFDITALKRAQTELTLLARHDTLTGLANRRQFIERLERALARSMRSKRPVALMYLDIDYFKQINDTFGHAAGDTVLCEFAQRLQHSVREGDLVARMGGDEFVVVIEDAETPETTQAIADKLIAMLDEPIPLEGHPPVRIGISVGIALSGYPADDAETLLGKADTALYEAKRAGRNIWRMAS